MINSIYATGNRIRDLPVCSAVPQAATLPVPLAYITAYLIFLRVVPWSRGVQIPGSPGRLRDVVL
jgi:hypothetical protein